MKKTLSLALLLSAGATFAFAGDGTVISVYGGGIQYENSVKDRAYVGGVYLSQSFVPIGEPFKVAVDAERTLIKYKKDSGIPDYGQKDLTGKLDFYYGYNWDFSFGGHKIFVDDSSENNPWASFVGIKYYKYGIFNLGVDGYYSNYNTPDTKFEIYQISPYFGAYFGNPYSYAAQYLGTYYAEIRADYQKFQDNNDPFGEDNYLSGEIKIVNYHRNWSLELNGEFGTSSYKMANGGYVMRNLAEQTLYSAGTKLNVTLTPSVSLSGAYTRSKIKYTDGTEGNNNLFLVFVNATF
jgi:hypothetical protein